ncbi:MAG: stress response translation initiation inhibitor YciH [Planctomycetes bacterium]|nr:stress response translation initiation inhibitor YciH [Planctomycetota bacterium]MCB9919104.1 stress response translation initiation inhibitor YciH [Planctomycetota bacterium]
MGIVWDSDQGATCPLCARPKKSCNCTRTPVQTGDGIVRLRIEKSGRKGKTVTVITGLPVERAQEIFKALKKRCGAGGSLDGCDAEIQGDHRDVIRAELAKLELSVKG